MSVSRSLWSDIPAPVLALALPFARGCYQRNLLRGVESLSGSTLGGKAASYGPHYARSRAALLARLRAAGFDVSERVESHGARVLVVRAPMERGLLNIINAS